MSEKLKSVTSTEGTGKNKVEKRISVEEISNGFIVTETKEWDDPKKGRQYTSTKAYSETNPLEEVKADLKKIITNNMPGS